MILIVYVFLVKNAKLNQTTGKLFDFDIAASEK